MESERRTRGREEGSKPMELPPVSAALDVMAEGTGCNVRA